MKRKLQALAALAASAAASVQAAVPAAVTDAIADGLSDGTTVAWGLLGFAITVGLIMHIKRRAG